MEIVLLVFIAAVLAGIISGLLGGGIGLVLVPALVVILQAEQVNQALIMHVAIGTTVAAIVVMGLVASYSHQRRNAVMWSYLYRMASGLIIGIIVGAILASNLSSRILMVIFGLISLLLGLYTLLTRAEKKALEKCPHFLLALMGFLIGITGSLMGVNPFSVPFFRKVGLDMRMAVGSSVVVGTAMAVGITIMFIIQGWHQPGLPKYSSGYVNWALFFPIMIAGAISAPLGAKIAHAISQNILRCLYGLLLVIVGIKMLVG